MLYELAPSDEVTGGTFYQDNELDVEFIEILSTAIYRKILKDVRLRIVLIIIINIYIYILNIKFY